MIQLKRVYDKPDRNDGVRLLIERLWPRGVRKAALQMDGWQKEAGPSTELRKWFSHDPKKWAAFQRKYFKELDRNPEAWDPIRKAAERGPVTLLYSSHDSDHNNAVALKEYVESKLRKSQARNSSLKRPSARAPSARPKSRSATSK